MIADIMIIKKLLLPLVFIAGGFLIGIIFEKIILRKIKKITQKTKWEGDDIVIQALHGTTTLLFLAVGIYWAVETSEISPQMLNILHKVILVIVIFSITVILSRIAVGFVNLYSGKAGGVLGDSSINFNVSLRAKEFVDQYAIRHELIKRLHKRYRIEGIDIPYPVRTIYMKDKV